MNKQLTFLLALTFLFLFSGSVYGDDFQDGMDAFKRKDYKEAVKLFLPLAEQGYTLAQYNLGLMYANGQGVPQDYKEAFKWWSLSAEQGEDTRFKPGQSGNPSGKPKGSLNRVTLAIQCLLDSEGEELTRKAIELAKEGDLTALKLCLERICPPRKSRPISIDLPDVKTSEGVSLAQTSVVQAVGEGEITPEEGQVLSNILESRRKSIETEDHERRLDELGNKVNTTNKQL
jgi:TPR repeat protein